MIFSAFKKSPSVAILMEEVKKGGKNSLEGIYVKCFPVVRNYVKKNSGTEEYAKDIFQDGIHVLFKKLYSNSLNPETDACTYLIGICRNLWLKKLRDEPKDISFDIQHHPVLEEYSEFEQENGNIITTILNESMEKTGGKCKNILLAFYYEKLSMVEIAQKFNYASEGAAKNRKYACLKSLINVAKDKLKIYYL